MTRDTPVLREPRQERSRTTRRRLIDAAVECLAELGWHGTTMSVVAERAGVSRGAAQHHFPTREDLVVAAVDYLADEQIDELRERAAALPAGPSRALPVAGMLLDLYTGEKFRAALHLWVAASTDEALRAVLVPLQAKVGREAHRVAVELLGADESRVGVRETVQATLDLARGLGLANLLADDTARRRQITRQWAKMLEPVAGAGRPQ
ncbi:TetR family transcriptional regulator [Prauserella sp. PE36]|uniref:TetR/AcrR family transcriptional regulator n=1 Tax=Prauserella endophytica TaxID=1592324 RepID=A0ABY2S3S8_9PSEU|nr:MULTISPECIES: TetR/AcrR family transcriptional regulator [Prauserella]PXY23552.1 TetR family transcriptional regulator [Prauserella coralliicola]RBM18144.1 TetR family transcriptional regulator [Prauserella sp. PE36]TKG70461.1 TetR/AcrR family transcriptional regulator [Prauserella endophytica]